MLTIISSNIRKHKSSMITLFILILLSTILLTIGFTVAFKMNSFFYDKVEELNTPHLSYYVNSPDIDRILSEAATIDGIREMSSSNIIFCNATSKKVDSEDIVSNYYLLDTKKNSNSSSLKLIDESDRVLPNSVAVPLVFRDTYGYRTGDHFTFELGDTSYSFVVHGFFEDATYGSPMMGYYKLYLYGDSYTKLLADLPKGSDNGKLIDIRLQDITMTKTAAKQLVSILDTAKMNSPSLGMDINIAKQAIVTPIGISAMMLIGFSFIVVLVAIIVVSFSIHSAIEDGIQSIGILKALGYQSSQIITSLILQYGILTMIASLLGLGAATFLLPGLGNIVAKVTGLLWMLKPSLSATIVSFALLFSLVILTAAFSARKTKRITPIMALRNGIETHNFKRNSFPLSKARLPINFALALKSITGNLKQNGIVFVIVIALTFASVFSLQLYSNMVADSTTFKNMMGLPLSNIWLNSSQSHELNKKMFEEIATMEEVIKVTSLEQFLIKFEDVDMTGLYVSDDFLNVNKKTLYEGRMPLHENEIAISNMISAKLDKTIGDVMELTLHGDTQEFLITGLTEQMSQLGYVIEITEDGMKRFDPNYKTKGIIIDLREGEDTDKFIQKIEKQYPDFPKSIMNIERMMDNSISSLAGGVTALVACIIVVMSLVVAFILYLLIKMKILREKTNYGIWKSLGFTTFQLATQIALSFTTVIGVGAILGGVIGARYTNNVVGLLFSGMGIKNVSFTTNYSYVTLLVIGITILSFVIALLVAGKIKKITPYNLLIE